MAEVKTTGTLRHATLDDVPQLLDVAFHLYEASPYLDLVADRDKCRQVMEAFIIHGNKEHLLLVSHDGDEIVGLLMAFIHKPLFSNDTMANECLMWLEPEYRSVGRSKELMDAYEYWAKLVGAKVAQYGHLSTVDERIGALYKRRGAKPIEQTYFKVL
jgi:GNAT superfamily N-acetyltransferase